MIETVSAERIHRDIMKAINSGSTYVDALLDYAKANGMEVELLGDIVKKSGVLFDKVREESIKNNVIKVEKVQELEDEWFCD